MPRVEIRIEKNAVQTIPEVRKQLGLGSSCLVVDDANTRKVAGTTISNDLKQDGCAVSEVIVSRPDESNVEKVVQQVHAGDFLVGVGGTSVLDITKHAADRRRARYILFSTGIANSGIISKTASISMKGKKESVSVDLADAVIIDLDVVSHAPPWMVAAGCGDLVIEATALKDWQLGRDEVGESYCDSIGELEMSTLDQIMNNVDEIRSRSTAGIESLVDALVVSGLGMAMWGSSRPSSGSEHLWSHWLDHHAEESGAPAGRHGEQVGIGTLLMAKYHETHNPNWWGRQHYPEYQAETLMAFLKEVGAPVLPAQIGVSNELAVEAFVGAWEYRKERYTILHKRHPSKEDAEKMMRELGMEFSPKPAG
jgi:glycerol-1-phosphate dehydrogenase [NAD(P)+]